MLNLRFDRSVQSGEFQKRVLRTITQLPFRYQEVVELVYLNGFSITETAFITDSTINTVKTRLSFVEEKVNNAIQ